MMKKINIVTTSGKIMRPIGASPGKDLFKREGKQPLVKPFNIRPSLEENKFSVLASLTPKLGLSITPFPPLPSSASSSTKIEGFKSLVLKKPFSQTLTSSPSGEPRFPSFQTSDDYKIKSLESYAMDYMDSDSPLKTRRYYEFILVDTGSIEIEHQLKDESDPNSV